MIKLLYNKMKTYKQEYNLIFEKGNTLIISCFFMIGILFLDNVNFILKTYQENKSLSVAILILFFIIILVKLVELKNIIKVRIINDIDFLIAISLISASILLIIYIGILKDINYKIEVLSFIMVISIIGLVIRIYMINNALMKVNEKTNIYTLKDLYENKISLSDSHTIFLNEEEESYDLLERNNIIEKLYEAIVNCNPKRKFIISLEGNWGSGKTTILNIVSKKINDNNKDIKIISSFDPWSYNDQISMFRSMFDILLKETGISYSIGKTKRLVNDIYNILFSTKYTKGIKDLNFFNHDKTTEIEKMKKMINNYLHISNKRIVFIIDNLDRAEKENIILLFKLVNNVFNFEYVTYILSFDDNKLKKILENQLDIDYEFISKIVQLPIKIPPLDLEVKNEVISTCFKNIIRLYGEDNLEKYNDLINSLSKLIIDMRDFKRFINSVVSVHYKNCEMLNPIDLISIELINFYNKDLYISIKENPKYYISSDLIYFNEYFLASIQSKKFNEEGKEYFDKLFKENNNFIFKELLSKVFPYVKRYINSYPLIEDSRYIVDKKYENIDIAKNMRIYSAKYFSLYFSYKENEFINISKSIDDFINLVNNTSNEKTIGEKLKLICLEYYCSWQETIFFTLQNRIDEINRDSIVSFTKALLENINIFDDSLVFIGINGLTRIEIIISMLLFNLNNFELEEIKFILKDYKKIKFINSIKYWVENSREVSKNKIEQIKLFLENIELLLVYEVLNNNIDIYKNSYYYRGNLRYIEKIVNDKNYIKKYVKGILNENNIIRFLFDMISVSYGTTYKYFIRRTVLDMFSSKEEVDEILDRCKSFNEDEKFVLDVYKKMKLDKKDNEDMNWNDDDGYLMLSIEKKINI
ncbi:KAP family NTPase [Clostridium perfringens]|uniref:KAP NTPase domain-containing protein n=4 Tax=Clostridium perfringens TaxID=1502 RepID=Q8XKV5_CLOPE|nr:KAP family NTPase [Clostridium perfringens]BAB80993.1 conserved hypothetical protein [Clostridium perfringens str. 13]